VETLTNGQVIVPFDTLNLGFGGSVPLVNGTNYGTPIRLSASGTVDTGFTPPRFQREIYPWRFALQSDSKSLFGAALITWAAPR